MNRDARRNVCEEEVRRGCDVRQQREERRRDRYASLLTLRDHYCRARFAGVATGVQGRRLNGEIFWGRKCDFPRFSHRFSRAIVGRGFGTAAAGRFPKNLFSSANATSIGIRVDNGRVCVDL